MTAAASAIAFTINRTALRGLAELAIKESSRFPGMTCVRIWGKGSKVFACATDGTVAGIWHEENPESFHEFTVYIPVATVKAFAKVGKKWQSIAIEIDGTVVKATAGGESVSHVIPIATLYDATFPAIDGFLSVFRPSGELCKTIPNIAYDTIGMFHVLSDAWGHPHMTSQGNEEKRPIFLQYPGQPNFVGVLMPLSNETGRQVFESPQWLTDLIS